MAWLEKRGNVYHVNFRIGQNKFKKSLRTRDEREAMQLLARVDRRIRLVEQGDLSIPEDAEITTYVVSDGRLENSARKKTRAIRTIGKLFQEFRESLNGDSLEENTKYTLGIHLSHIERVLGGNVSTRNLTVDQIQKYIDERFKQKGRRGRPISPVTIRKELASFRGVWSWAEPRGFVRGHFPNQGLRYPKANEKPPFQTLSEIERQVSRGGLTDVEECELWECLFLSIDEIQDVLKCVERSARQSFIFPMFVLAAHTGARRSELIRSQANDIDFDGQCVTIRERKRVKGKRSFRTVSLSPSCRDVMREWLKQTTGRFTFSQNGDPLTVDAATYHFRTTLDGAKWEKIRGWHMFRHSFISNCASKGVDQRIIDDWVGHQTDEMRRRYRHLFPNVQQKAIASVFGRK